MQLLLISSVSPCPYTEGKERPKKEADHSRLVGGRFNKQGVWLGYSKWLFFLLSVHPLLDQPLLHPHDYPILLIIGLK